MNHQELLTSIAKTLSQIADVLPRVEMDANLYKNPLILRAISKLYAHIITFIQFAVRWYRKGKLAHSLASILKPFQIKGRPIMEEISECSKTVERLAMSANRAETRVLHQEVRELTRLEDGEYCQNRFSLRTRK